jgi:hypothetical protein
LSGSTCAAWPCWLTTTSAPTDAYTRLLGRHLWPGGGGGLDVVRGHVSEFLSNRARPDPADQPHLQATVRAYARRLGPGVGALAGRSRERQRLGCWPTWGWAISDWFPVSTQRGGRLPVCYRAAARRGQARRSGLLASRVTLPPVMRIGLFGGAITTLASRTFWRAQVRVAGADDS